jgi:hypothetical protein
MGKIQALHENNLGLELLQTEEECLPDVAAQGEASELAFPLDADEAGVFQFLHMMRERCGGDGHAIPKAGTAKVDFAGAQAFENLHAPGVADGFQDRHALNGGESFRGICGLRFFGGELGGCLHYSVSHSDRIAVFQGDSSEERMNRTFIFAGLSFNARLSK